MEEEIKSNIEKLRNSLKEKDIDNYTKIRRMALLRYYLGEQEKEEEKVKYNKEFNDLDLSESIEIGKEIIQLIAKELQSGKLDIAKMQELHKLMKDNFYYLARYLFSYYLIAIEFGIPKEKQFYAPRDMVLGKIAKRLDVFYYSYSASIAKDKFYNGIMTIVEDENGNYQKIFPNLECIYKNAETMSLDYADDGRKRPHSEYTLYCAGFDGGITGRTRAHNVLYLDDLVKNMEAANNKDVMDKMNEEFNATLRKRMQGNCKMLIIGTLFSINDPFTRTVNFFKENAPDRIEVIRIPRIK